MQRTFPRVFSFLNLGRGRVRLALSAMVILILASVAVPGGVFAQSKDTGTAPLPIQVAETAPGYTLGQGDKIRVTIFGESELSGEYTIDPTGLLSLPLVGGVNVGGLDVRAAEQAVAGLLMDGYLMDPRVSIEVLTYRPFYILGEVRSPGEYEYVDGMTVLTAVAIAGGFTYRADEDEATVISANDPAATEREVRVNYRIQPGDVVRIEESFF